MNWGQLSILIAALLVLGWLLVWSVRSIARGVRNELTTGSVRDPHEPWPELPAGWKVLFAIEIAGVAAIYGILGWKNADFLEAPPLFFPLLSAVIWVIGAGFVMAPLKFKPDLGSRMAGSVGNWARLVGFFMLGFVALALATAAIGVVVAVVAVIRYP